MAKYRKKPVVIEAVQWHGFRKQIIVTEVHPFDPYGEIKENCSQCRQPLSEHGSIPTLEGSHIVCPGDWIITGIQGEKYPCKPDIFEATYERAQEES